MAVQGDEPQMNDTLAAREMIENPTIHRDRTNSKSLNRTSTDRVDIRAY